jgi:hypothetical protein
MESLGDVDVRSAQTLTRESRINHSVDASAIPYRSFREQTIAPHSAPTVEFTRSAFAQEPNVHRGWLYFRKVASPEVSLIYRSLRRRILPRQSISAL